MKKIFACLAVVSALVLAACDNNTQPATRAVEQAAVENNQQRLISAYPPPLLTNSLERQNLIERLQRINQSTMTGCIYLISHGSVMASYPVRGKVTSLNAYLTGAEQIVRQSSASTSQWLTVEMPDHDGAYGKNADGVFFFTADSNAYVEWAGDYLWSDQCLALNQQPQLTRTLSADE